MQESLARQELSSSTPAHQETAAAWTIGLRGQDGEPPDPLVYEQTRKTIANIYGLSEDDPAERTQLELALARLALLPHPQAPELAESDQVTARVAWDSVGDVYAVSGRSYVHAVNEPGGEAVRLVSATYAQAEQEDKLFNERQALEQQVIHDALTGALNVRGERQITDRWIQEYAENGAYTCGEPAVLLADATRFKQIDDVLGHTVGDHALIEAVQELEGHVRQTDNAFVARVGGDEFELLVDRLTAEGFSSLCSRILDAQETKVADDKNIKIWEEITWLKNTAKETGGSFEPQVEAFVVTDSGQRRTTRRYLYINGRQICQLRDLVVLSIGAIHAAVPSRDAFDQNMMLVEDALQAHKAEMHQRMGGAYRVL